MGAPVYIFVVPYRDRESFKNVYLNHMIWILEDETEPYEIIFSHQDDLRPFNRGAMKNLGFWYIRKTYPNDYKNINIIFQDVDTMPGDKKTMNFETTKGIVKHYYGFNFALGGIFSIKGEDFERTNGFPNFWGWGFEDNAMNARCKQNKITIDRDNWYKYQSKHILQFATGPYRLIDNSAVKKLKNLPIKRGISDIKDIEFNVSSLRNNIIMVNFTKWSIPETSDDVSFRADIMRGKLRDHNSRASKNSMMHDLINFKKSKKR